MIQSNISFKVLEMGRIDSLNQKANEPNGIEQDQGLVGADSI